MTEVEAEAILGAPLLRSVGQDFAVWIYNHRAELVFYGSLIARPAPREGKDPGRVVDVGQALPQGDALAVAFLATESRTRKMIMPTKTSAATVVMARRLRFMFSRPRSCPRRTARTTTARRLGRRGTRCF